MSFSWVTPPTFADGSGNGPTAANFDAISNDLGFINQEFPIRAEAWHRNDTVVVGNALTVTYSSVARFGHFAEQDPGADGDSFEQSIILAAGTYTMYTIGRSDNQSGKLDWSLNGTIFEAGQNWYSAAPTANVIKTVASVVVVASGRHTLNGTVNGKDGSSGTYHMHLTRTWLVPAEDVV